MDEDRIKIQRHVFALRMAFGWLQREQTHGCIILQSFMPKPRQNTDLKTLYLTCSAIKDQRESFQNG